MPTLHRLESESPFTAGVLITWEDGSAKQAAWTSRTPVDPAQTARRVTEQLIEAVRDDARLNATNWVSVAAGVAKHVQDWNATLPLALN